MKYQNTPLIHRSDFIIQATPILLASIINNKLTSFLITNMVSCWIKHCYMQKADDDDNQNKQT